MLGKRKENIKLVQKKNWKPFYDKDEADRFS